MTEELNIIVEELLLNSLETGCSIAVSYYHIIAVLKPIF